MILFEQMSGIRETIHGRMSSHLPFVDEDHPLDEEGGIETHYGKRQSSEEQFSYESHRTFSSAPPMMSDKSRDSSTDTIQVTIALMDFRVHLTMK